MNRSLAGPPVDKGTFLYQFQPEEKLRQIRGCQHLPGVCYVDLLIVLSYLLILPVDLPTNLMTLRPFPLCLLPFNLLPLNLLPLNLLPFNLLPFNLLPFNLLPLNLLPLNLLPLNLLPLNLLALNLLALNLLPLNLLPFN